MYILMTGIIINAITVINSMSCDEDWLEYEGNCFKHYTQAIDWHGAQLTCVQFRKAQLATIDSPDTNIWVHNNLTKGGDVWIGLDITDITKLNWKWSDGGDTSSYDDWTVPDVNSACAVMKYHNNQGYWYTRPCTSTNNYVCEKEQSENCSDWLSFDTHCYLIIPESTDTNMEAALICWEFDAYLISINSKQEADFIYKKLERLREYWIGLSPLRWVNDVPYQWNNWDESGPFLNITNGCVYMSAISGKWSSGHCGSSLSPNTYRPYICQRDAVIDVSATPNIAVEVDTPTNTVQSESNTTEFDALNLSNITSSAENSKQLLLTVIVPAICGGLVAFIVIIIVVIVILRKRRSNGYNKRNQPPMNTTYVTNDKAVREGGNEDKGEHQGHENYIYDEAEVVQADNGTVVVNGDVYAIVDKDKTQNPKVQDNMVSQQHTKNNIKQEIAKGQNHIIIGADVYAIVNKNSVQPDSRQKPKQKKKKPPTPPKLEDNSSDINSNGLSHIAVCTDVYAVVDKEKVKPNKQQKPQQRKKKPPAPPKLVDTADVMHEGSVYNESDINAMPATPTKRKPKGKKETEDTGIVYADLDLTASGSSNRQSGHIYEQSGVVYADVRG